MQAVSASWYTTESARDDLIGDSLPRSAGSGCSREDVRPGPAHPLRSQIQRVVLWRCAAIPRLGAHGSSSPALGDDTSASRSLVMLSTVVELAAADGHSPRRRDGLGHQRRFRGYGPAHHIHAKPLLSIISPCAPEKRLGVAGRRPSSGDLEPRSVLARCLADGHQVGQGLAGWSTSHCIHPARSPI